MDDPGFRKQLSSRYAELRNDVLSNEKVYTLMDSLISEVDGARESNFKKWTVFGDGEFWPNHNIVSTYDEEIALMKSWIEHRSHFLDEQFIEGSSSEKVNDRSN